MRQETRGESAAARTTGPPERIARRVLKDVIDTGLLASDTPKGPVSLRFPPAFDGRDLLSGQTFVWRAGRNYVRLPPGKSHVVKVLT